MDANRALQYLYPLAEGIDPITGEVYSKNSPLQHVDVVRALYTAIRYLEKERKYRPKTKNLRNAGKPWSKNEEKELLKFYDAGVPIADIAINHKRTKEAIKKRLVLLGRIT